MRQFSSNFLPILSRTWDSRGSNGDLYSCCCQGGTAFQGLCMHINTCYYELWGVQYIQSYSSKKEENDCCNYTRGISNMPVIFLGFISCIWKQQTNWNGISSDVFSQQILCSTVHFYQKYWRIALLTDCLIWWHRMSPNYLLLLL